MRGLLIQQPDSRQRRRPDGTRFFPRSAVTPAIALLIGLVTLTGARVGHAQMVPAPPPLNRGMGGTSESGTRNIEGQLPEQYEEAGVTQKLEAQIPLDATFVDSTGKTVQLGDYFDGERPVLVNMAYYECPALCPMVWQGMVSAFGQMDWTVGEEFKVVTISFSPSETPEDAREKKEELIARLDKPEASEGWHFLTGQSSEIERVAKAVGFGYKAVPQDASQFAHQAAIMVLSPDGRVMRYMGGVKFPARTLTLSMVEASEGKAGSLMDQIALFCGHYDASSNTYVWASWVMRAGGGLTIVALGAMIAVMIKVGRRRRAAMLAELEAEGAAVQTTTGQPRE